ncbi:hypothetical protein N431DRAFT_552015 [Stipitochalara longipes BDJ]|nr:hypothetical protein N431DRAFT_552015 [Stipitochalara longipes BDJ]
MHEMTDFDMEDGASERRDSQQPETRSRWATRLPFLVALGRPLQLMLSFLILCLAGYVVKIFGGDYAHTFASSILSFAWTIMLMLYIVITPLRVPKLYNRWTHYTLEFFTLVVWVVTFALFVGECQTWDAAEDAVADVLTPDEVAAINSVPGQDSAIMAMRAATWLSGGNSVFFFLSLITCILGHVRT